MQEKLEKRIYRNRRQQRLELKTIYEMLMEGKRRLMIVSIVETKTLCGTRLD